MSIVVENVNKNFGTFEALKQVNLTINEGSLLAILGPSGSGKSTLLRVIAGLELPDSGRVLIDGRDCTDMPVRERNIGFVFQHYAAFKHMTVFENVAFALRLRRTPKDVLKTRVKELLELVQLSGYAKRYPGQLSGGQRQRMALARSLAAEPKVLLLDEPFGALDARVRSELRDWLRRLHSEVDVTTVFVTHDQEEAMEVASDIAVVNAGRIEQVASPLDIYERPANSFVMGFIGPVTKLGDTTVRPHDFELFSTPHEGSEEALIERIVHLGFEVRVELLLSDKQRIWVQLSRVESEDLELTNGQIIFVRRRLNFAVKD